MQKLKSVINHFNSAGILTSVQLKKMGIYSALLHGYNEHKWLESIGRGAYVKFGVKPTWEQALNALQFQLEKPGNCSAYECVLCYFIPLYSRSKE